MRIVYEDAFLVVVDKPHGLLSVPGRGEHKTDSVVTRLKGLYPMVETVHRLDFDTSGLMVFPIQRFVLSELARQFQRRQTEKAYEALVYGLVNEDQGEIDLPLIVDWENRPRQKVCHDTGKPSLTRYRVIDRNPAGQQTRLELMPVTGRSHQLRVHCQQLGHAILGDSLYAQGAALAASDRLCLHAKALGFCHPESGRAMRFTSPIPF